MKKSIKKNPDLAILRNKMSYHFDLAFGHGLSDEEHESHFNEYMKYRKEYENLANELIEG